MWSIGLGSTFRKKLIEVCDLLQYVACHSRIWNSPPYCPVNRERLAFNWGVPWLCIIVEPWGHEHNSQTPAATHNGNWPFTVTVFLPKAQRLSFLSPIHHMCRNSHNFEHPNTFMIFLTILNFASAIPSKCFCPKKFDLRRQQMSEGNHISTYWKCETHLFYKAKEIPCISDILRCGKFLILSVTLCAGMIESFVSLKPTCPIEHTFNIILPKETIVHAPDYICDALQDFIKLMCVSIATAYETLTTHL